MARSKRTAPGREALVDQALAEQAAMDLAATRPAAMNDDEIANFLSGTARKATAADISADPERPALKAVSPAGETDEDDQLSDDDAQLVDDLVGGEELADNEDEGDDASTPDEDDGDEADGAGEDGDESDDDDVSELDIRDDDEIVVRVDGEEVSVSIRDLKAAYSGEGAIQKRLKEATDLRKEAETARNTLVSTIEAQQQNMASVLNTMAETLFMPMVEKPDPSLRAKNMQEYLMQKDAYDEDQARIAKMQQAMAATIQQQQAALNELRRQHRMEQAGLLRERLPELQDPKAGKAVYDEIINAAKAYGFDDSDIAAASDHRLFLMARDAGRWRKLQSMKKDGNSPKGETTAVKPRRRLRAGGASTVKAAVQQNAKRAAQLQNRAAKSGKVDDIAAMLAGQVNTSRRR